MNRIYRLVWNRALRVMQVVSELAHPAQGGGVPQAGTLQLRKHPLALACAAALAMTILVSPAYAGNGTASGGAGASAGQGSGAPIAAGNGGSAGINGPTAGTGNLAGAAGTSPGGDGGDAGQVNSSTVGAGGGGGGANGGSALSGSPLKGGNGGMGGWNGYSGGGGGGGGGFGVVLSGTIGNLSSSATLTGGTGGTGGVPSSTGGAAFGGGGGGGGGSGVYLSTNTTNTSLTLNAAVAGGAGGAGGDSGGGGWNTTSGAGGYSSGQGGAGITGNNGSGGGSGGGGGAGLSFNSSASGTTSVINATTITGGAGGNGGTDHGSNGNGGNGGQGGVGVDITGSFVQLINTGSISGGDGGQAGLCGSYCTGIAGSNGLGNAGLVAHGNDTIINSGSISGGLSGGGSTRADAVDLSGGDNTLTLEKGFSFAGSVVSTSGTANGGDTLALGGSTSGTFNASAIVATLPGSYTATQYIGFNAFTKTGTSTWILTGTGTNNGSIGENWKITDGTLQGDATSLTGNLTFQPAVGAAVAVVFDQGSDNANSPPVATYAGTISGNGSLTKTGTGTLTLSGANTYAGGSVVNGGTLSVAADNNLGASTGSLVLNGGTLENTATFITSRAIALGPGGGTLQTDVALTVSGVISGVGGSLTKTSAGTLTLTGANPYSGGTTISAGTLQIGDGTGQGSITGNVTDDGTLTFDLGSASSNGYSSQTYSGTIAGSGLLRAVNTSAASGNLGVLALTGANSFVGGAEIGGIASGETGTIVVYATNVNALGTGVVTVNRPGELWISAGGSTSAFVNTLNSTGYVNFQNLTLGSQAIANGAVPAFMNFATGSSAGSATIANAGILSFSNDASAGTATIRNSGSLTFGGTTTAAGATLQNTGDVGIDSTYSGNLSIGSLSGSGTVHLGSGTLILGGLDGNDTISGVISDGLLTPGGSLAKTGTGILTLDGQDTYTGGTEVQQGTLVVGSIVGNGASVAGNVTVDASATLRGHGTIGGNVDVQSGGIVTPGDSIGTLTVNGDFIAAQGSQMDFAFGAPGANFQAAGTGDNVTVGGNLELDGATLNVSNVGGMGPGLYTVFSYGGTLTETNGGLSLGSTAGQSLFLQNLTSQKQINLIDTTGYAVDAWNANGQASSTQMGGGSGTWSATSQVWTDATGTVPNGPMSPQPGFAIFAGTPGTVTVDNGAGSVSATGLQFATSGYTLGGGTLTLVANGGVAPIIRVGDGTSHGAGITAAIGSAIAGSAGLTKADLGTLVLTGANTWTGGTTISAGSLQIGNGGTTGAITGNIADNGMLAFDRNDAMSFTGIVSGSGALTQLGTGTLSLTGAQTYAGTTTIAAGTLALSGSGSIASSSDVIANGIFDISGTSGDAAITSLDGNGTVNLGGHTLTLSNANGRFGGVIAGTGGLTLDGGTEILTGDNTFTGVTTIGASTLQVGNGGITGAITGNVTDNGTLVFDRSDAMGFGGTISGSGALVQAGSGTLTLTGTNTYSGGTTINAGTLQVGNGGTTGAITGNVIDNGTLAFDRSDAVSFAGVVSGNGALTKLGSGTLTLTGTNTFSGGTTLDAGTLSVASDAGLGAATGALKFDGGMLKNTAAFSTARAIDFVGSGTLETEADLATSGTLTGSGAFIKSGTGTLILDGNSSSFTGTTSVQAGTLEVGDAATPSALLGGNVSVAGGGILRGHGTIGGSVTNNGTLWAGGSIGTLMVQGNYTQGAPGVFEVETTPAGQASLLRVGGTASLAGTAVVVADAGNWAPRTSYTILTAAGGVSGTFGLVSDNLAFLDPVLSYQSDAVELSLERNDINFNTVAITPNEQGVATGANGLGWNSSLYNALVVLDAPTARAAFDQISGEYHASQQTARINDSRYVREAMDQRLIQGSDAPEAAHVEGTALDAWAHAWGHWGTTDSDGNAERLADNGDGLLIGADLPVGMRGRVGVAGGASRDSLSIGSRASWGRLTSQWLGAFGGLDAGAFALRGGIAYAWDQVPGSRQVNFPGYSDRLSSNAAGDTLTGFVEGAWTFKFAQGSIAPFVNLAHTRVETDAGTEAGGAAALNASEGSANVSFSMVGARESIALAHGLDVHGELGWQHAFGDTTPARTLQFGTGGPSFTEYGVPVAKNAGLGKIGLGWHAGRVVVEADYEGLFGGGAKDQAAKLSVNIAL